MSVTPIALQGWIGPGCSTQCHPRSHDPASHERFGYERALADQQPRIVRTGPLVVDLLARAVTVAGAPVVLTDMRWGLLAYLAERLDAFCAMNDVLRTAFDTPRPDLSDATRLRMHTWRLRADLGPAGRLIVAGSPGRGGLRLVAEEVTP